MNTDRVIELNASEWVGGASKYKGKQHSRGNEEKNKKVFGILFVWVGKISEDGA